jgi:hypothetical protein
VHILWIFLRKQELSQEACKMLLCFTYSSHVLVHISDKVPFFGLFVDCNGSLFTSFSNNYGTVQIVVFVTRQDSGQFTYNEKILEINMLRYFYLQVNTTYIMKLIIF